MIQRSCLFFFTIVLLCLSNLTAYEVIFQGVEDEKTLKLLKSVSILEKHTETTPSYIGLKRRAENDIETLAEALHSLAYYDAKITFTIDETHSIVTLSIDLGPVFTFESFNLRFFQAEKEVSAATLHCPITNKDLGIHLNSAALPEKIISAEDTFLDQLNSQGYAFAKILKRDVYADLANKKIVVWLMADIGPLTYMGPTKIQGLERLHKEFVLKKLRWHEGDIYNPKLIEKTQGALELSGLFKSINIGIKDEPTEDDILPVNITLVEAKQRSVGFGLSFTTELGFGINGEWEDRNILNNGQKLSLATNIWQKLQDVRASYLIPDYLKQDQNLIWVMDWHHDRNKSYSESVFAISGIIESKISDRLRISYGGMYKLLRSMRSARDGTFDLIKAPLQLRWITTDSILEPTKGITIQLKAIPSLQVLAPQFAYCINSFTGTHYQALTKDKKYVFATKLTLGSIIGASKHDIPPPERFYAGSENSIRGYRFLTISPLGKHDKPLGGRSLFVYTMELRTRIGDDYGLVFFYDMGNVYKDSFPKFSKELLQAAGLGLRYYTPIGPLRLDLAFPLNRRHKVHRRKYLDSLLEAYFSIGQSF